MLDPHLRIRAAIRGMSLMAVEAEFLHRVHQRHLASGSLSVRPSTPPRPNAAGTGKTITVHRVCNGCGGDLGDATMSELAAAYGGLDLPDVRLEHGCYREAGLPRVGVLA